MAIHSFVEEAWIRSNERFPLYDMLRKLAITFFAVFNNRVSRLKTPTTIALSSGKFSVAKKVP